jgi:isopentenyl diphosphate isomerase/L-lactate dehydrogenase-like FMN-dependent dehydrogenase
MPEMDGIETARRLKILDIPQPPFIVMATAHGREEVIKHAEAVGNEIEVWMDGGIRSGQDVLKARALGARGTLIGRSFLYALGAYGEAGVTRALQILHKELDITMAFCGRTQIDDVDSSILLPGTF